MNGDVRDARLHYAGDFRVCGRLLDHFNYDLVAVMPEDFVRLLDLMEACLNPSGIKVENVAVKGYEHDCLCVMYESVNSTFGVRGFIVDAEDYEAIKFAANAAFEAAHYHMDVDRKLSFLSKIQFGKAYYTAVAKQGE